MNWSRIKNIMIFFLIAMNLFMVAFIAVTTFREATIPEEVVSASIKVLEGGNFQCNRDIFPAQRYTLPDLDVNFHTASELSDLFFGKQLAFRTVEGSLVAGEGRATLTVSGNHFSYENGYDADSSHSASKIKRTLEKAGIDMHGAVYDEKEDCFYYMYKNVNLFNMYLRAKLDSDGELCEVLAQWPSEIEALEDKTVSFTEAIMKVKSVFPDGGSIKAIEPGYSLHPVGSGKYIFSPAWRVNVDGNLKIIE